MFLCTCTHYQLIICVRFRSYLQGFVKMFRTYRYWKCDAPSVLADAQSVFTLCNLRYFSWCWGCDQRHRLESNYEIWSILQPEIWDFLKLTGFRTKFTKCIQTKCLCFFLLKRHFKAISDMVAIHIISSNFLLL